MLEVTLGDGLVRPSATHLSMSASSCAVGASPGTDTDGAGVPWPSTVLARVIRDNLYAIHFGQRRLL